MTGEWIQSFMILSKDILNNKKYVGFSVKKDSTIHRKLELFTEYQYIRAMMTLYTLYTVLFNLPRTDWSCVLLDMVVPYPN